VGSTRALADPPRTVPLLCGSLSRANTCCVCSEHSRYSRTALLVKYPIWWLHKRFLRLHPPTRPGPLFRAAAVIRFEPPKKWREGQRNRYSVPHLAAWAVPRPHPFRVVPRSTAITSKHARLLLFSLPPECPFLALGSGKRANDSARNNQYSLIAGRYGYPRLGRDRYLSTALTASARRRRFSANKVGPRCANSRPRGSRRRSLQADGTGKAIRPRDPSNTRRLR
jgi:hypothetical protein